MYPIHSRLTKAPSQLLTTTGAPGQLVTTPSLHHHCDEPSEEVEIRRRAFAFVYGAKQPVVRNPRPVPMTAAAAADMTTTRKSTLKRSRSLGLLSDETPVPTTSRRKVVMVRRVMFAQIEEANHPPADIDFPAVLMTPAGVPPEASDPILPEDAMVLEEVEIPAAVEEEVVELPFAASPVESPQVQERSTDDSPQHRYLRRECGAFVGATMRELIMTEQDRSPGAPFFVEVPYTDMDEHVLRDDEELTCFVMQDSATADPPPPVEEEPTAAVRESSNEEEPVPAVQEADRHTWRAQRLPRVTSSSDLTHFMLEEASTREPAVPREIDHQAYTRTYLVRDRSGDVSSPGNEEELMCFVMHQEEQLSQVEDD